MRKSPNLSGPLMLPNRASANSLSAPIRSSGGIGDSLEDKSKGNVIQIKGRFSVTSEHLDLVKVKVFFYLFYFNFGTINQIQFSLNMDLHFRISHFVQLHKDRPR